MKKTEVKCSLCHANHYIDKWGWVQSCIGYFDLNNLKYEMEKWNEKINKRRNK